MLIVGGIVGAGFASGQEIVAFFAQYGFVSLFFIIPVFFLLYFGIKQILLRNTCQNKNPKTEKILKIFSFGVYILVSGSMLSGANSLLSEIFFDFGFPVWSLILIVVSTFVVNLGINGLLI